MVKRKRNSNKKYKQSNFARLSIFQPSKYKFNKNCPLSGKGAPIIDYKNIKLLKRYMSENGKILWSKEVQTGMIAPPITYEIDGEQYIKAHPLVEYSINNSNLIITPHCGGYSQDAVKIVCQRAMEKAINYLN